MGIDQHDLHHSGEGVQQHVDCPNHAVPGGLARCPIRGGAGKEAEVLAASEEMVGAL